MAAKPVVTTAVSWPTRADALAECNDILRGGGYQLRAPITDRRHIEVLTAILEIHPHSAAKAGQGVDYFFIDKVAHAPGVQVADDDIGFWIMQKDGTAIDISYVEAISPSDHRKQVTSALRAAVDDERLAYRDARFADGTPVASDISGNLFARRADATVIYQVPSFSQLAFRFAESEGGWGAIDVSQGGGSAFIGDVLVDPGVAARWVAFWRRHAVLALASKSEGARRAKVDETGWRP
ncbi:DUF3223 domain-containing protein [Agromyces bauzanensis]|uniref:DUF3223 domain-containing protein n=1 Tax=Agromyces bauzanensis TaxID=1308924 RepID=A0A917PGB9_9MICO|nr:DUF3223 domain-containing protein [Agromyces bauzanensis]GGJ76632.1 hypothetical protein GCM10011372_13570 [Agromyces bauzanensis]